MDLRHVLLHFVSFSILIAGPCLAAPGHGSNDILGGTLTTLQVYDDALRNDFLNWSWATHDLLQTTVVHSGTYAISMQARNWEGLFFHRDAGVSTSDLDTLRCWVRGNGAGGQAIRLALYAGGGEIAGRDLDDFVPGGAIPGNAWAQAIVPLSALGTGGATIDGVVLQAFSAADQGTVYFDDVSFEGTPAAPGAIHVAIDPDADVRAIDPAIYGVNFGTAEEFTNLPYPVRRWGGNATTRYSWRNDTSNRAMDWFFMNVPNDNPNPGTLPHGSSSDRFNDETLQAGADVVMTVPTIGWAPRDRSKRWGFSISKYGTQTLNECEATGYPSWCEEDAGNGIRPGGANVTGNDPLDTSNGIGPGEITAWMTHMIGRVGNANGGGVRFYALDNEPMLWNSTHRDVHPDPVGYDELWSRNRDYALAIKAADPGAKVLGPVVWGWCAYFYSAIDGCAPGSDRAAHGGIDLIPWYLDQVEAYRVDHGLRLVDYLDIHYYPQASGVALTDDESAGVAARRLRSLKSLYDPSYVDESWIGQPVELIPRMRRWIDAHSPGTKLALTEYHFGGDTGISSALAQAEALAIFGREGVDLATRWVAPQSGSRVEDAFRMYLNYDGGGEGIDGESVRAVSSDVEAVGSYAVRNGAALFVLLFNKADTARDVEVAVAGGLATDGELYRFDATADYGPIGSIPTHDGNFSLLLPARSATLLVGTRSSADVAESGHRLPAQTLSVRPSPFTDEVEVAYRLEKPSAVDLEVFDIQGRLVRTLSGVRRDAGQGMLVWDGLDDRKREVPAGVYRLLLHAEGERFEGRVVRLR